MAASSLGAFEPTPLRLPTGRGWSSGPPCAPAALDDLLSNPDGLQGPDTFAAVAACAIFSGLAGGSPWRSAQTPASVGAPAAIHSSTAASSSSTGSAPSSPVL